MLKVTQVIGADGSKAEVRENDIFKSLQSPNYKYRFNKRNGLFVRFGRRTDDDPDWSIFGPEIADIEISTVCDQGCKFCYKSNTSVGENMSLQTFEKVFEKLPATLTQIAFGIGSIDANVDLFEIFSYCRQNDVVPNVTINGFKLNDYYIEGLKTYCGAVAVSLYDYEVCYEAIRNLGEAGMNQLNIHAMLSEETYDRCMQVMKDAQTDERLKKYLNAIVFLWLKPKGRGERLHQVSMEKYKALVKYALENKVRIGFDSCSASNFMKCEGTKQFADCVEPCESTLFSIYINVRGEAFPCSFAEDVYEGTSVIDNSFKDVWMSKPFVDFRTKVIANKDENGCRMCPIYNLGV